MNIEYLLQQLQSFPSLMDIKAVLPILTVLFIVCTLFFGTRNGFYDSDKYHGNGSAH